MSTPSASTVPASPDTLSSTTLEPEEKIDEVKLFMLYTLTGGDVKRVSVLSRVESKRIEALAHDFNWKAKLNGRLGMATEQGQEEERVLNRLTNYVTAERLGRVFGRLVDELDSDPTFAKSFCTVIDTETQEVMFNTKNLIDLAKGLQVINDIKYRALQDKQAQTADVSANSPSAAQFSLTVYAALSRRFDANVSVDTSAEIAKAIQDVRLPEEEKIG